MRGEALKVTPSQTVGVTTSTSVVEGKAFVRSHGFGGGSLVVVAGISFRFSKWSAGVGSASGVPVMNDPGVLVVVKDRSSKVFVAGMAAIAAADVSVVQEETARTQAIVNFILKNINLEGLVMTNEALCEKERERKFP